MQQSTRTLLLTLLLGCMVANVLSICNMCQSNNVACVNSTHFKVCYDDVRSDDNVLDCGPGKVCTSLGVVCIDEGAKEPSCPTNDAVDCRACDGNNLFVCTSRKTFQMCHGNVLSSQISTCPGNKVCSIDSGEFCVNECNELVQTSLECDKDAP